MQKYIELAMKARGLNGTEPYLMCERCGNNKGVDFHHVLGRTVHKEDIDTIIIVCRACHEWIHTNNTKTVKEGLLEKIKRYLI